MRKLTTLCLLFVFTFSFCQNFEQQWKKVYNYELDGKTQSAQKEVEEIYKKAKKKNDEVQIIKCFFYLSKFEEVFNEKSPSTIISNLKNEIRNASPVSKSILNHIYATILQKYYNQNSYSINRRTDLELQNSSDFSTWTYKDFSREIEIAQSNSIENENELRTTNIDSYKDIFEFSSTIDSKNYSLYDYLIEKYITYNKQPFQTWMNKNKNNQINLLETLYKDSNTFTNLTIEYLDESPIKKFLKTIQRNEKFYLENNPTKANLAYHERLKFIYSIFKYDHLYLSNLISLEKNTTDLHLKQQLRADRVKFYFANTYKNSKINYYKEALPLIDTVLKTKINNNALAEVEIIKNNILQKSLNIQLKKIIYPNENTRAFVQYKNVDSIKISYYKFPIKHNEWVNFNKNPNYYPIKIPNTDSLILNYIHKNTPLKSHYAKLPKKEDYFYYSTEILLEKLEVGNYLIFVEASSGNLSNAMSYTFENITVTNLTLIHDSTEDNTLFYVLNRKTGEPLKDVFIKNEDEIVKTNKQGKTIIRKKEHEPQKKYKNELQIYKENDTLLQNYQRGFLNKNNTYSENEFDEFEAKAMLYFDRAIYRPGQKVFFKGILMQKKDNVKSIVPFVTVNIEINDVNDNSLKKFDIQTNEFGSFSGEFDIPKNVLTGRFNIYIDEADDYTKDTNYYDQKEDEHKFWDNVDYNDGSFYFQVEEYKRPTFEIKFDEIKENYTIGDSIKISGNAKTFAGNILTNAKVTYTVTKNVKPNEGFYETKDNYIVDEIYTDEKGNFTIDFLAVEEGKQNEEIDNINFQIEVTITDSSGETRTSNQKISVGKKTLKISADLSPKLFIEELNFLTLNTTTLNNFPIDAKGEIKIFALVKKDFLKSRQFDVPEIKSISKSQFEQLFPNEPYENENYQTTEVAVKIIPFDTKVNKKIALDFMKNWKKGAYKVIISSKDTKNNLITIEKYFSLDSKITILSHNELFTFKDISKIKSDYLEFEIQSVIPDLYVTSRFYNDKEIIENEQIIQLKNGKGTFKYLKKSTYQNDIHFHFSTIWDNQSETKTYTIEKEDIPTKLNFEIVSFRNKIEPGSLQNWSFKILNQKFETEVLAGMYDSSLDQFNKENWSDNSFDRYQSEPRFPDFSIDFVSRNIISNFHSERNYFFSKVKNPEMYWFGFEFNNSKNPYTIKKYLETIKPIAETPLDAKTIIGTVFDQNLSLPGVSITVKGTSRTTMTDFDGNFSIEASKGETLLFGFIGMIPLEVIVDKRKIYEVHLEEGGHLLGEVVLEGYRASTKETSVSAVSTISNDASSEVLFALQGQVAGVSISNFSGQPCSQNVEVIIRGVGALNSKTEPLYVIDGVPMDQAFFRNLNADDIESVSVLKDAAATAIYGSRGANGVVVINTKSALKELAQVKTRTNFNETAFFYPHLKTDSDGKFSFNFTNPESLTSWKLRLYGHNKKAESGYFESTILSQKDLMVQTNMPRFVREKDTISISAKVVNMTTETKSGIAMLLLFDATNMKAIDSIALNTNNTRNFTCKPKESVPVTWKITIPEGLQGLQYKIVAKSGNFSDGEENILPVLSNKILITESVPIWVKGNSKKEYVFENLKNNSSTSLKNHQFTLEYTSNPTWLALQSLPYLMEFQHECAEQTFSRYYGNFIATEIINSNPKIASLFESWKKNPTSISKLNQNEELKSIVLNETPWLLDAENEGLKNKRLALLMDLNTMKESQESTFKKLEEKQLSSGAFPWFDGGDENHFITQHIVAGLGHLGKLFPESYSKFEKITSKAIPHMDNHFIKNSSLKSERMNYYAYSDLHYLYARSFYLEKLPISKKIDSIIAIQKVEFKANWLQYSLYKKALLALTMHRLGDKDFAKKIITNLKETVARNDDFGMYWVENKNGYYWYQSAIETQALLIETFAEIEKDKKYVDEMKVWLLKQKQLQNWPTTKATTEAVYALLLQGSDWSNIKDNTKFKIGNEKVLTKKLSEKEKEAETGYIKMDWNSDEITKEMGSILVENKSSVAGFGGLYWQYFENLENIESDSTAVLSINKILYKKVKTSDGNKLVELKDESLKPGDLITIRLILKTENDLEFVHLKDLRASSFEPVDVISKYESKDGLRFYRSTKDVATHFFFDTIEKGTYVLEYDIRINHSGSYIDGISTLQSMYAPEFSAHSTSSRVKID